MDLAIVIVNYQTPGDTIAALESLAADIAAMPAMRTVVVENGSGDDSAAQINAAIASRGWVWVSVMELEQNVGFARGNNVAVEAVMKDANAPQYVLLLNPDTIVRPGALQTLVDFMDANQTVGMAGARLEDPDGTPQTSAFRFPTVWSELEYGLQLGLVTKLLKRWVSAPPPRDEAHETDWVAGAAMIIRREVIAGLGLFDPDYFMYYEEVDFCLRAKRAGWSCWYVPAAQIVHLVGRASGITVARPQPKPRPTYWFESRRRFFVKNLGALRAIAADLAFATAFAAWRVRRWIQRKPDLDPPGMLWDFLRHSVFVKGTQV